MTAHLLPISKHALWVWHQSCKSTLCSWSSLRFRGSLTVETRERKKYIDKINETKKETLWKSCLFICDCRTKTHILLVTPGPAGQTCAAKVIKPGKPGTKKFRSTKVTCHVSEEVRKAKASNTLTWCRTLLLKPLKTPRLKLSVSVFINGTCCLVLLWHAVWRHNRLASASYHCVVIDAHLFVRKTCCCVVTVLIYRCDFAHLISWCCWALALMCNSSFHIALFSFLLPFFYYYWSSSPWSFAAL